MAVSGISGAVVQPGAVPASPPPPPASSAPTGASPAPALSFTAPISAATTAAASQASLQSAPTGSLSIVLATDTTAGVGPAQFRVLVDGKDVTGVISSETAQYGQGQYQTLTINGQFANAQTVDVQTVGGSGLHVKEIAVGGQSYQAVDAEFSRTYGGVTQPFAAGTGTESLYWQGDLHFQTSANAPSVTPPVTLSAPTTGPTAAPPPPPGQGLVLTFSSTNAAEFRILVNGQDVTGRIVGTAQTALGQTQTVTVAGDFSNAATVQVQKLNSLDGFSSNTPVSLNVQSLAINGQTLLAKNAEFTRSYAGVTPTFTPGTGTNDLYWNGILQFTPAPVAAPPPSAPPPPPPPVPTGRILTVGAGEQYATLAAAAAASRNGDTIAIKAGTYVNQVANINTNVTIEAMGGPVVFTGTQNVSNRKAYLVVNGNVTIEGITFENAKVSNADGGNGAGIRFESGNLVVKNSTFINNQDGILTTGNTSATLTVDSSTFIGNGSGSGFTHAIYAGTIKSLTVTNSGFEGTNVGHDVKSRAASSTITGNTFDDNATASYAIDLPNGGTAVIANNVIAKATTAQNTAAIHYGGEVANPIGSLTVTGNTIVNQRAGGVGVRDQTSLPVSFANNNVYGETALVSGGPASVVGNIVAVKPPAKLPLPTGYAKTGNAVFSDLLATFKLAA
jgi:hypothetical protein